MARPITPETRLRNRVRDLERRQDSWHVAVDHADVWQYLDHLASLAHIAHHGIRRPDDLGGTINGNHAASRPPHTDPSLRAAAQLRVELAHLRERAAMLGLLLADHDGGKANGKAF